MADTLICQLHGFPYSLAKEIMAEVAIFQKSLYALLETGTTVKVQLL